MSDIDFGSFRQSLEEITEDQAELKKILNDFEIKMAFFRAAQAGETNTVLTILSQNPSLINERNWEGNTAFLVAVEANQLETVEWLMKFDSDLKNQCNKNGDTALMLAIEKGYIQMVCFLLQKKPDLNRINKQEKNAYELAQNHREDKIAILIKTLKRKPDKNIKRKKASKTGMEDLGQGLPLPISHNALLVEIAKRPCYVPQLTSKTALKPESEEANPPESVQSRRITPKSE